MSRGQVQKSETALLPAETNWINHTGSNQNKENQMPDETMNLTSHPSQITKSTQIGNITVEQIATALGSETDHLIEALEAVYPTPSQEDQECQVVEPQ